MKLTKLKWEIASVADAKTINQLEKTQALLADLETRDLSPEVVDKIESEIKLINDSGIADLKKSTAKAHRRMVKVLYEDLRLVPISYYKTLWMSLGMAAFGLPMGIAFSTALGNYAFIGIGLPIGMVIGMAVGHKKDEDAKKNGLQLNVNV